MAKKQSGKGKRRVPKAVLRLPDLDQAKSAALNSLSSMDAQRGYRTRIVNSPTETSPPKRLQFCRLMERGSRTEPASGSRPSCDLGFASGCARLNLPAVY
jgi:hypothetical protein